jgi:ABC-type transport system involved in multi-copper enzyme maturation permease subunit
MSAFLAIVGDTWRQSKQQVVLVILIILMLLISIGAVVIVRPMAAVHLDNVDGRLTEDDIAAICNSLEGSGEIDQLGGMFGAPRGRKNKPTRSADFVVTFDSLEQAEAAAKSLAESERLRGQVSIVVDGDRVVFEGYQFADEAAELLTEEAPDSSNLGFETAYTKTEGELGPVSYQGDPALIFSDAERADAALQFLLDSKLVKDLNRFKTSAEMRFGFIWDDTPNQFLFTMWEQAFAAAASLRDGDRANPEDLRDRVEETAAERRELLKGKSHLEISTESYLGQFVMALIFTVTMLLFIAASASYYPGLLASGAVDVVVSRPVSRLRIFLGRYFGGLLLYAGVVFGTAFILWVGMGIRLGYWPTRVFIGAGLLFFAGAVIYALLAFLGVLTRSTPLGIILGLVYYFVIDTVLSAFFDFSSMGAFQNYPTIEKIADSMRTIFPNFGQIKGTAQASILTMPYMDWTPIYTGGAWLLGSLALGYLIFRRKDY